MTPKKQEEMITLRESGWENNQEAKREKDEFSMWFREIRKETKNSAGKRLRTPEVAELLGIDYEHFRKIINRRSPTKNRDCIIAIGLVLKADLGQINRALILNGFSALYKLDDYEDERINILDDDDLHDKRDEVLIRIIEDQDENQRTIARINEILEAQGLPALHIIDKRGRKKETKVEPPFIISKYYVRTRSDELIYGDRYNSLENEYHPNLYIIQAGMLLIRVSDQKKYELSTSFSYGAYDVKVTDVELYKSLEIEKAVEHLNDIQDDNPFYNYVLEIKSLVKTEFKKRLMCLYDTKNFMKRTSARLIDGKLHVFSEAFNYRLPEWNEYGLVDYCEGRYVLYVSSSSMFMRKYLNDSDYTNYYGLHNNQSKIIDTDSLTEGKDPEQNVRTRVYRRLFEDLKSQVDDMLEKLKTREVFIRNLEYICDMPSEVLDYYRIADQFECERNEYGDAVKPKRERIEIEIDTVPVSISLDDVCQGFELGLDQIEEIAKYKKMYGDLKKII